MYCGTVNLKWCRGTVKVSYTAGWEEYWDDGWDSAFIVKIESANWAFDPHGNIDISNGHDDFKDAIKKILDGL